MKKLDSQKETLSKKSKNIFNIITGKDKEIALKMEQLELRKELLKMSPMHRREDYTIHELMAKVLQYKDNNGVLPESLKTMASQIKSVFKINNNEVKRIMDDMTQPVSLVPIEEKKTTIFNRRSVIENLKEQNQNLRQDLQRVNQEGMEKYKINSEDRNLSDVFQDINKELERMKKTIETRSNQRDYSQSVYR